MPIKHDNANITIEFAWQSEETGEILYVKHYAQDGVPTVSVSDDNKEWYHFPAAFFREVTEFLGQQRIFKTAPVSRTLRSSQAPPAFNAPTQGVAPTPSRLAPPVIDGSTADDSADQISMEPLVTSDTAPLQSFAGVERLAEKTSSDRPAAKPRMNDLDADMLSRPVIKSADEATSALLRGGSNPERAIRRLADEE